MPFTPVEEQHYQSLFQQMCEDCGVDNKGNPISEDWDPEEPGVIEQMRTWLVRLRQTALHPEVGGRNRRALGRKQGPLRTVDDVLAAMLEQSEISIRVDQRALLLSKLKRGQTYENGPEVKRALVIWTDVLQEASEMVSECRQQLFNEIIANTVDGEAASGSNGMGDSSESDTQNSNDENR
jgi:E3 ubiquitin-protein ligase SHPRH